ncbi:MAG: DEAD/DEAH box helicase [Candidatus Lokiarchaeota archaeon]|nr:DEAD/DEAH box helicase [Candidatus Lokiarchaeota archaeon]
MKFNEFGIKDEIVKALEEKNIIEPTKIQKQAIPIALEGKNIIAQAKTGSGKTYAFSIPIINQIKAGKVPECLILVPTRELCRQVAQVMKHASKYLRNVRVLQVYGGISINPQILTLQKGVNIVVATPGRLIDLYERKEISFDKIRFVVLDEADRMLDMGFFPDIQYIMNQIHTDPQLMLFSATILEEIKVLSQSFTRGNYTDINVSKDSLTVENTNQLYYLVKHFKDKYYAFVRVLRKLKPQMKHVLVFTNTKKTAMWLKGRLERERNLPFKIEMLSGDLSQAKREVVTKKFKNHEIDFLIATDVAARGLDIANVSHVINYDVPQYTEIYVHRIGRTSRMGKEGTALTFALQDEYRYICQIEGFIDKTLQKVEVPPRANLSKNSGEEHRKSGGKSQARKVLPF